MKVYKKKAISFIAGVLIVFLLVFSGDRLRPFIVYPWFLAISIILGLDAVKIYKNKELWNAERQLKTWITGKSSYLFFKVLLLVFFTIIWLFSFVLFLTTGDFNMSWEAIY